jgi:hypothetical protein
MQTQNIYREERERRFASAFQNPDDLVASVMGNAYLEFHLFQIVRRYVANKSDFDKKHTTFTTLIKKAKCHGALKADLVNPLIALGNLRNQFAHGIDFVFSDDDIAKVKSTIPKRLKPVFNARCSGYANGATRGEQLRILLEIMSEELSTYWITTDVPVRRLALSGGRAAVVVVDAFGKGVKWLKRPRF